MTFSIGNQGCVTKILCSNNSIIEEETRREAQRGKADYRERGGQMARVRPMIQERLDQLTEKAFVDALESGDVYSPIRYGMTQIRK
jgi:hypothetical protein